MDLMQAHQVKKPYARYLRRGTVIQRGRNVMNCIDPRWMVYDDSTGACFADTIDEAYRLWVEMYINFALYRG